MSFILNPYRFVSIVPCSLLTNTKSTLFDGTDDYVLSNYLYPGSGDLSVSFWIKTTSTAARQYALSIGAGHPNSGIGKIGFHNCLGLRSISTQAWDITHTNFQTWTAPIAINDGNWHHVLEVYDDSTSPGRISFYIDGALQTMVDWNCALTATELEYGINTGMPLTIGSYGTSPSLLFTGNIDEVAIFESNKSANALALWNSGEPCDLADESGLVAWYRMGDSAVFNANSQWEFPEQTKIDNWSSHSTEFDGALSYGTGGKLGANQTAYIGTVNGADRLTASAWIYMDTNLSTGHVIIDVGPIVFTGGNFVLRILNYKLNCILYTPAGVYYGDIHSIPLPTDEWIHVAMTWDGSTIRGYINGSVGGVTVATNPSTYMHSAITPIQIGAQTNTHYQKFNGKIDEVSVFRSVEDISRLYNSGTPTDLSTYSTKSFEFDGVNDVIQLDSAFATSGTDWSISFWWKSTQTGGNHYMVGRAGSSYFGLNWNKMYYNSSVASWSIYI